MYDGLEAAAPASSPVLRWLYDAVELKPSLVCHQVDKTSSSHDEMLCSKRWDVYSGYVLRIHIPDGVADVDKRYAILQDVMNTATSVCGMGGHTFSATVRFASDLLQSCGFFRPSDPRYDTSDEATRIIDDALRPMLSHCDTEAGKHGYVTMPSFEIRERERNPEDYLLDVPVLVNLVHLGRVFAPQLCWHEQPRMVFAWSENILQAVACGEVFLTVGPRNACVCDLELRTVLHELPFHGSSLCPSLIRQATLAGSVRGEYIPCRWGRVQPQATSLTLTGTCHCPPSVSSVVVGYFTTEDTSAVCTVDVVLMRHDALSVSYSLEGVPPNIDFFAVTYDASPEEPLIIDIHGVFAFHLVRNASNQYYRSMPTRVYDSSITLPLTFETHWNTETPVPDGSLSIM